MPGNPNADVSMFQGIDDAAAPTPNFDVIRFVDGIRKRWWLIILTTGLSVGLTLVYTSRQPREYKASAHIVIETSTNQNILGGVQEVVQLGTGGYWATEAFYAKEYRVLRSRRVARLAGEMLRVTADDKLTGLSKIADPVAREKRRSELDPADFVLGHYTIAGAETPNIVRIDAIHRDPTWAKELANAVASAYVEQNGDKRLDGTRKAGTDLEVQYAELRERHRKKQADLYAFLKQKEIFSASLLSQKEEVLQRLREFNGQLAKAQAEQIKWETDSALLARLRDEPTLIDSISQIRTSPIIAQLKATVAEAKTERMELATRYQSAHPKMVAVDEKLVLLEKNLNAEIQSIVVSLERERDRMTSTVEGLKSKLREERAREARLNEVQVEYDGLKEDVDADGEMLQMVKRRMREAGLSGAFRLNNAEVIEPARRPGGAFRPSYQKNVSIGGIFGLLLGLAMSILLVLLDNTVRSEDDIQVVFPDVPFLGVVPNIETESSERGTPSQERDLYVSANPKSSAAEAIRFIRTNLMFMTPDKPLKTLLVTSPLPREGKTMSAINLAVTMAQQGGNTVIVDCDMRRPRLHRALGLENQIGISSLIAGDKTVEEVIQQTSCEGLSFIACGPVPPNPAELLHNQRFAEVLEMLQNRFTRVIFDSPPVNAVADPVIIGTQVDGTVIVMHHRRTTKVAARRALGALKDANAPMFGFILNDVNVNASRYAGGYYGGYYRNYAYYGEGQRSEA